MADPERSLVARRALPLLSVDEAAPTRKPLHEFDPTIAELTPSRLRTILVDGVFGEDRLVPSCGIAALGGYLRSVGIEIELFAPNNRGMNEQQAADLLLRQNPDVIGLSMLSRLAYDSVVAVVKHLDEGGFGGFLCIGGHYGSLAYRQILTELPSVDCVVIGDGELPLQHLLNSLDHGLDWSGLPGLARRTPAGEIVFNGPAETRDLGEFPPIATDMIAELVESHGPNIRVGLVSSRGCYADCSYCSIKAFSRLQGMKAYRMRPIDSVVDEIELIQRTYGVKNFSLEDDNFLVPGNHGKRRAAEFRDMLRERGIDIRLTLQTRPECITTESISALKEAGLVDIFIGTESFDQDTLELYHRNNTVEQSVHAMEVFESLGFGAGVDAEHRVRIGSMVFHPYVTLEALKAQAAYFRRYEIPAKKLVKRLRPAGDVPLCRKLAEEGLLNDSGEYDFLRPEVTDVYQRLREFYGRFINLRERIRVVEKKARLHDLAPDLTKLTWARRTIDDHFIDLFEALCRVGSQGPERVRAEFQARWTALEALLAAHDIDSQVARMSDDLATYCLNN